MQSLVQAALNQGFNQFLITADQSKFFNQYPQVILWSYDHIDHVDRDDPSPIALFGEDKWLDSSLGDQNIDGSRDSIAYYCTLSGENYASRFVKIMKKAASHPKAIIVHPVDWKIIPLENLISKFQQISKPAPELIVDVGNILEDIDTFLNTLEHGVDGILFQPNSEVEILTLRQILAVSPSISLIPGTIQKITSIPQGDRVCVDTSSLLKPSEGMLVGNMARGFALIEAEVHEAEFVSPRPFRVNAGDVSEYILSPLVDEKGDIFYGTRYLAELQAGDQVLIVNNLGGTRFVAVSRVKIETRPLLIFEISVEGLNQSPNQSTPMKFTVTCQNAETVRFLQPNGQSISVSAVSVGDQVLISLGPSATHFGTPIDENIIEK